jgi:hypothetical protein
VQYLVGAVRRYLGGALRRISVVWSGVAVLAALLFAAVFAGRGGWGAGSPGPLLVDLALLGALVGIWWWHGARRRTLLSERRLTSIMESSTRTPDGLLQGALEMEREVPGGVSPGLARAGLGAVSDRFPDDPALLSGAAGARLAREARRGGGVAGLVALLLVGVALWGPGHAPSAWAGLLRPLSVVNGPVLPPIQVFPGNAEVERGGSATLEIQAPLREAATVEWQAAGDVARSNPVALSEGVGGFTFQEVGGPITYRVVTPDGARTEDFQLTPVDPLFVNDVTVRLEYPAYLDRPPEEFRGEVPPLTLPAGTELELLGRASRPLQAAALTLDGERIREIPVSEARFRGRFQPRRSGEYAWDFMDRTGAPAALTPQPLRLTVVGDSTPEVAFLLPSPDTLLPGDLRQPLVVEARDDHGLRTLELIAWRVTALGDALPPVSQAVDLGGSPAALARPLLDVSRWELVPGDRVQYYAQVRDIHPSGQSARTDTYTLRMPTAEELRRRAQGRIEDTASRLREMQDQADRAADEARNLERSAAAPDREGGERPQGDRGDASSFQEREEVRQALAEQKQLSEAADSLGRDLGELSESLENAGAADPELSKDIEELQQLLEELGGEDLQERLESLMAQMDQMGARERQETLEELTERQEAFREQLREAVERAQRAAVEQDFRNTTDEAEALAQAQEALSSSMSREDLSEEETSELRSDQQGELAREARALQERMDELGDRLRELGEEDAARELTQAQNAAQRAAAAMERAASEAGAQSQEAASTAQSAAQEMSEAAQELMEAQQQMMSERARAFEESLRQTARDALSLAGEQARVREEMAGSTADELAALRAQVSAVQQGVASLAENNARAAQLAGADDRELSRQMGEAMESLARSMDALARSGRSAGSPEAAADQSISALNDVARSALGTLQAMAESAQPGQPSPEQMMEQMEEMAQQQADLNNQASQMMPMQLTPQAMQEMMQQMAQEQQQIASDLGQMSNQEGEDGPLGDVEAMAAEAEALARELEGGRLDSEVRERQERLFHRLLDAGRGLEKEEESTERESGAPGEVDPAAIPGLRMEDLGLSRFQLPDAAALNRLPPAARAMVLRYFQLLNRQGGGLP